ncbi:MAG: M13 family metallopeptidase N-terminal domain-containing protein, partial [Luteimonas sp.]
MNPKLLLLSMAVTAALAGCQKDAPAPVAKAPTPAPAAAPAMALPPTAAFAISDLDTSKNACDDLSAFVNGKWLAAHPVPSDRTTWGSFEMLNERSQAASRNIAEAAAADAKASGVAKLVGDFYATGMDEAAINTAGLAPLQPILQRIDALKAPADVGQYLRDEFAAGRGDVFSFGGEADFKNSSQVIGYAYQGGLSLPEKAYYLEDGKDGSYVKIRDAFVAHVSRQLQNAGAAKDAADQQAKDVLAFETRLAKASLSQIELRDPNNQYHYVTIA